MHRHFPTGSPGRNPTGLRRSVVGLPTGRGKTGRRQGTGGGVQTGEAREVCCSYLQLLVCSSRGAQVLTIDHWLTLFAIFLLIPFLRILKTLILLRVCRPSRSGSKVSILTGGQETAFQQLSQVSLTGPCIQRLRRICVTYTPPFTEVTQNLRNLPHTKLRRICTQ